MKQIGKLGTGILMITALTLCIPGHTFASSVQPKDLDALMRQNGYTVEYNNRQEACTSDSPATVTIPVRGYIFPAASTGGGGQNPSGPSGPSGGGGSSGGSSGNTGSNAGSNSSGAGIESTASGGNDKFYDIKPELAPQGSLDVDSELIPQGEVEAEADLNDKGPVKSNPKTGIIADIMIYILLMMPISFILLYLFYKGKIYEKHSENEPS